MDYIRSEIELHGRQIEGLRDVRREVIQLDGRVSSLEQRQNEFEERMIEIDLRQDETITETNKLVGRINSIERKFKWSEFKKYMCYIFLVIVTAFVLLGIEKIIT